MYQGSKEIVTISFTIREAFLLYQKLSVSVGVTINTSPTSPGTGDIDFGPNACIELYETQLRWSDYYLKGINTDILEAAPVKIFVMGANVWRDGQEWPLWHWARNPPIALSTIRIPLLLLCVSNAGMAVVVEDSRSGPQGEGQGKQRGLAA